MQKAKTYRNKFIYSANKLQMKSLFYNPDIWEIKQKSEKIIYLLGS